MRRVLISTKPFIFVLFPVGVTVRSAESLSSAIPLGTSTERANSKRANHGRSRLFQDAVSSVSFWLRSFSVCGWRTRSLSSVSGPPTRWSCVRGWLMRLLWAYEHDFAAISPFLYERIGTLCRHPRWSLWLEQRIAGWRSGRSEGYCKSTPPRTSYSSRSEHPVRFPGDFAGLSHGAPSISFGAPSVDRMSIAASGMGSRPLRMKVRWGCPPRVLSPPPHRTQSWWPCLPGQPWASGWRSTDRPVPSPRSWTIGFSERGAAHNRALPRCLSSRRCMRSWRVGGWPLSRPGCLRTHRLLCHPPLLPFTAPPQVHRLCRWSRLHSVWRRGSRCPACLAGSRAQFDSATRFSSPGDLPSSTAFSRRRWQSGTPLSCARRLLSSWQRMQSSRSLQPRWGRGFTALTLSYPRKVVAFGQSWICESWTGLCTSSRSRCWRTGAWSNAFSPRIGLQRSTWRTLTFTFRSFRDTDRFYGLRSKVGHGSTGSSPSGSPCLPVCSRRL